MGDLSRAIELAEGAGRILLDLRASADAHGLSGRSLKDAGDRAAQQYLGNALAHSHAGDAVLSEEAVDDPSRLRHERVWIIDPLDGTREYSEFRDDWAVHVALWERGQLAVGAVALPAHDLVLSSDTGALPPVPRSASRLRLAVSRTRAHQSVLQLARELDADLVPMGSAGFKVCAVVRGEVDAYVHAGGQYEWDSAAPVAVARSHGLHASRIDGAELEYNQSDPYLPDLLVCRPEISQLLLDKLAMSSNSALD
ncbi:3'(2'),5'-bisphosphate nucleotidase CysQ [Glutamicibacter creatinolyticus]|uniref:3'(2'),5'-bisphosphate nucleotidase CysQ n=1 Tax=Glutamicibacter creatinolyticus TaxID=162496 RepID=UPI00321624EF